MKNRIQLIILVLIILCSGISGVFGNIATSSIPDSLKEYIWIAWPLFLFSLILLVVLGIWQSVLQNREVQQQKNLNDYQELIDIIKQIEVRANKILIENQQLLSPIFDNEPSRSDIEQGMMELFQIQQSRPEFARWVSYLQGKEDNFEKDEIKKEIRNLRHNLIKLQSILYENYIEDDIPTKHMLRDYTKKYIVKNVLGNNEYGLGEVRNFTNKYLENLRQIIEAIGKSNGKLQTLKT